MLLRAPASWPGPVVAVVAMLLLAPIDLAAAYVAKEAVARRSLPGRRPASPFSCCSSMSTRPACSTRNSRS